MGNKKITSALLAGLAIAFSGIWGGCGDAGLDGPNHFDPAYGLAQSDAKTLNTTIKTMPPAVSNSPTAKFTFTCNQAPCTFKCSLDFSAFKACATPKTYKNLATGDHVFQVEAVKSGKTDSTPANYWWNFSYMGTQVSGGTYHTCALTSLGGAQCWGTNDEGRLGNGTTVNSKVPVPVSGLSSGLSAISAGYFHSCALTTGGGVKCWGYNYDGELGNGSTGDSKVPTNVSGLSSGISQIFAGNNHSCVLANSGAVRCWGLNNVGQLGDGSTANRKVPVTVSGLTSGVSAIASGGYHACALTTGGAVKCWGYNYDGELGDGSTANRKAPVNVSGLTSGVTAIAGGQYHTCALISGGIVCWGANSDGRLGDGTTVDRHVPAAVTGSVAGVSAIDAGGFHTCAIISGGAKCWGSNMRGQLGDGSTVGHLTPAYVSGMTSQTTAISAGNWHACAATSSGAVKCWGYNFNGQLGDGSTTDRHAPVAVFGFVP